MVRSKLPWRRKCMPLYYMRSAPGAACAVHHWGWTTTLARARGKSRAGAALAQSGAFCFPRRLQNGSLRASENRTCLRRLGNVLRAGSDGLASIRALCSVSAALSRQAPPREALESKSEAAEDAQRLRLCRARHWLRLRYKTGSLLGLWTLTSGPMGRWVLLECEKPPRGSCKQKLA